MTMRRTLLPLLLLPLLAAGATRASAQTRRNAAYERYIDQYKAVAVDQMRRHGIPASITLAQGLLESGAGSSDLAQRSNNHFGIKKGSDWTGPTVRHHDDRRNELFRKYDKVADSYEDHSLFLHRERYQRLFRLHILDYKGWARGLKACGYATNPLYADKLIGIIELYGLSDFDEDPNQVKLPELPPLSDVRLDYRAMRSNNGVPCVVARRGDTWASLSGELGISERKLLKFNEAVKDIALREGDYVYLEKKASRGPKSMRKQWHKIQNGESMYSIAQLYGMRLRSLYKLNYKDGDYNATPGDLLRVR